jgi:predicted nucleotidyltransferase component of viral defense system
LIQLDTAPHNFIYNPDKKILNKFEVFTEINVTPIDIILSQKIATIFGRKTAKGRDFYDVIFLLSKTKPSYDYLRIKLHIDNAKELRERLLQHCEGLNLGDLTKDVEAFLFSPQDSKRIILFEKYIKEEADL